MDIDVMDQFQTYGNLAARTLSFLSLLGLILENT